MKKQLLFLFLLFSIQSIISQENYETLWNEVEKYEIKGQTSSALDIVEKIFKKAARKNNSPQIVKSFIYKTKFALILNEVTQEKMIKELEEVIKKEPFPTSALLESVYAAFLEQYLEKNRYRIKKRAKLDSSYKSPNFKTWDINTLIEQIHKHFQLSLEEHASLKKNPLKDFDAILTERVYKYHPTLFDFLAQRAMKFYKDDKSYVIWPKERFYINSPIVFTDTKDFIKEPFYTIDSIFSKRNVLKLYQQLESFHLESKNDIAYIDVILSRLNFAKKKSQVNNVDTLFIKSLERLRKQFKNNPISGTIDYHIANHYYNSTRYKSHEICSNVLKNYPNTDGATLCESLKNKLEEPHISIKTERYVIPKKPILAQISFKEIDTLTLSLYKIPMSLFENAYSHQKDSIAKTISKNKKATTSKTIIIKSDRDFYHHTTEIDIPSLDKGTYLIYATKNSENNEIIESYGYSIIHVTNIALLETNFNDKTTLKLLNRETGKPLKNINLKIQQDKYIYTLGKSNSYGEFDIKKNKKNHPNLKVVVLGDNDTIPNTNLYLSRNYNYSHQGEELTGKAYVYLDRSIYRPGQTMYFKALITQKKGTKTSVVPNVYLNIIINDANYDELKEFRLKTNEYGSVSGEFKIPNNTLTGEFSIEIDEDWDYEEDEHPFWDALDDFEMAEQEFSVEEYKRPRFEVLFDPIKENYLIGDTIRVRGKAKALMGSNITEAKVEYTIERNNSYNTWNRHGNNEEEIKSGELITDANGEFVIKFLAIPDSTYHKIDRPIFNFNIFADVIDINGETRSAEKTVKIGYHNIVANVLIDPKLNTTKEQYVIIDTKNLNGEPITAQGIVNIYKLNGSERILKERPWDVPEIHQLDKDAFIDLFPHISYSKDDKNTTWNREEKVFSSAFNTSENNRVQFTNINEWPSGKYAVEVIVHDQLNDTLTIDHEFTAYNPKDSFLPNNQMFDYQIMNSEYRKDGYIAVKLSTSLENLTANLDAYHNNDSQIFRTISTINNGNEIVRIPIKNKYNGQIDINIYWTKLNTYYSKDFSVVLPQESKSLNIETMSFRNKLQPDQKETWSFKITDINNKNTNAELLASMYDASLDQFKDHYWDHYTPRNSTSAPYIDTNNSFSTSSFNNLPKNYKYNSSRFYKNYPKLKWFGLNFNNISYANNTYLNKLISEKALKNAEDKGQVIKVNGGLITGYIGDNQGPLPGVNVVIKGTNRGTITDFDGNFSIKTKLGDVIVFSYIGFIANKVKINNNYVEVFMEEDLQSLDEVIIIGYGVQTRSSITGSVSTITVEGINNTIENALQGIAAGVRITKASGAPGATRSIRIRGSASISQRKQPLLIVDGVLQDKFDVTILPQDIIDITVLKDASAKALYGSKASHGVIIITTKKSMEELLQVEPRNDLKETAFFFPHLKTDNKGEVSFSFNSPQALTKWRLMLFAHTKDYKIGSTEKIALTQKDLMVIPNAPRFFREKDTILFSAKITNLTKKAMAGISTLQLYDAISMQPIDILADSKDLKSFAIPAMGNKNITWKLIIPEGLQALQYKILAKAGSFSDGEENTVPVLSNRLLVTEAKPLWVKAGTTKSATFNKLKNNTSKTLTNHKLTLEYTSNPTWYAIQSLPYLIEYPYECAEQTFSRYYANTLASYIANSNPKIKEVFDDWNSKEELTSNLEKNEKLKSILISETPWVRDAQSETEKKKRIALLFDSEKLNEQEKLILSKLSDLQLSSGAFPWFSGGRENEYITRHILAGFGHLSNLNIEGEEKYKNITMKGIRYIDKVFSGNYNTLKKTKENPSKVTLNYNDIHYLYTRSFYLKKYPLREDQKAAFNFFIHKIKTEWLTQNLYSKGMIALFLHRIGETRISNQILTSLKESAVKTEEEGMYWKENTRNWHWYKAPIETHALIIEAFSEIGSDTPKNEAIIEELKLWLLKNKKSSQWSTTKATTEAIYALMLHGKDWLSIEDNTVFNIGSEKIKTTKMDATKKEAKTGYLKINWSKDEITPKMAALKINNKSDLTGYGGFYWQYFEDLENIKDSDKSPLKIKKDIFLKTKNNLTLISEHTHVKLGDLITVRIEITSKNNMEFVHMKDMRASGLEPINVLSKYKWQDGLGYYESTKDASTNFFFDYLPKGVYVFEYDLRVNNAGNFSNGITTIQSMYAPEFSSHSEGVRIQIEE